MFYDPGTLYIDPWLSEFSVGYGPIDLVGLRIMPEVGVDTQSGKYRVFDKSGRVRFYSRREPGAVANEIRGRRWSEDAFKTKEHSLQAAVADEERQQLGSRGGLANAVNGGGVNINPEQDATAQTLDSLLLEHEIAVASVVRNTATYPGGHTITLLAADAWDNYAGATSNPIDIVRAAILKVTTAIGRPPNTMLMSQNGVPFLENHPDTVARFTNFNLTDPDAFRELTGFEGQTILIGSDVYNDDDIAEATTNMVSIWGKDVWIGYVDPNLNENDLSFGKTFAQRYPEGGTRPVDRWREEGRKSDLVRTSWKYDPKVTMAAAGYLIKDAFQSSAWTAS